MPPGFLELPKSKWKAMAGCLERKLSGQNSFDLNSVSTSHHRSLGPEFVVHETWRSLIVDSILANCGFSPKERVLDAAVVACRLIDPGSDLSSWG